MLFTYPLLLLSFVVATLAQEPSNEELVHWRIKELKAWLTDHGIDYNQYHLPEKHDYIQLVERVRDGTFDAAHQDDSLFRGYGGAEEGDQKVFSKVSDDDTMVESTKNAVHLSPGQASVLRAEKRKFMDALKARLEASGLKDDVIEPAVHKAGASMGHISDWTQITEDYTTSFVRTLRTQLAFHLDEAKLTQVLDDVESDLADLTANLILYSGNTTSRLDHILEDIKTYLKSFGWPKDKVERVLALIRQPLERLEQSGTVEGTLSELKKVLEQSKEVPQQWNDIVEYVRHYLAELTGSSESDRPTTSSILETVKNNLEASQSWTEDQVNQVMDYVRQNFEQPSESWLDKIAHVLGGHEAAEKVKEVIHKAEGQPKSEL
ncbi:hypothetical protein BZG36_05328 [Bifiguratus adelaidae]|uniref:Uncharacterized protein n=1 Tax=Bifiguratus adelaidae TaxID=1938954 RepID=A0A261XTG9_9FUNG|nr:hypothetical protein BZG36_05328 [Bifiguratus adelaidae]